MATGAKIVGERYDPQRHAALVQLYQHDPHVVALVYAGHIHWLRWGKRECVLAVDNTVPRPVTCT